MLLPRCRQAVSSSQTCHHRSLKLTSCNSRQWACRHVTPRPRSTAAAAAAAASPSESPAHPSEQSTLAAQPHSQDQQGDFLQDQEQQQQQQQVSSSGVPPGPMTPPDEEPKKLSAAARLSEALESTSIVLFGDDTELNWAVCQVLSKKIGWFPVSTRKVLLGLHKAESLEELIQRDGLEEVVAAEAKMLRGMRDQRRCCIATIGDAAAADSSLFRNLYGSILIWLDEEDKRSPKQQTAARVVYEQEAEIRGRVVLRKGGFGEKDKSLEDRAAQVAGQLIKAMLQLLKDNEKLLVRKLMYMELGCRGDWPQLQPADWNPVLEGLDRASAATNAEPQ